MKGGGAAVPMKPLPDRDDRWKHMDSHEALAIASKMVKGVLTWYLPDSMRWHYEDGLFLFSAFTLAQESGDDELADRVLEIYGTLVREDGTIASYRIEEYNLDQINAGRLLFDLHARSADDRYMKAVHLLAGQLRNQPRTLGGSYWHKQIYPWQVWLDGLYMAQPFQCRYALLTKDAALMTDTVWQLVEIERRARDPMTGLLYHAWDESKRQLWADPSSGCSPHFWGRAVGWYCMALVDVFALLGPAVPGMNEVVAIIGRIADAVCSCQDESGLWYQILDQAGREGNYLESSCSAMFAYFLLKGVRLGLLDEHTHVERALHAFESLLEQKVSLDGRGYPHLHDICAVAGLGGSPYRDGSFEYYVTSPVATDDLKGVGPFVLAALEIARLPESG